MYRFKYRLKETEASFSPGSGEQYSTPKAFKKKYKYKLKEEEENDKGKTPKQFQQERLLSFKRIYELLGQIQPLLKDAQKETEKYYKNNPEEYEILYGTDIIISYLEDILKTLRPNQDETTDTTREV